MNDEFLLDRAIDDFWRLCRTELERRGVDLNFIPLDLSKLIHSYANKQVGRQDVMIAKSAKLDALPEKSQKFADVILKLFDASSNGYVSVTNILLEYHKLQEEINAGRYQLQIENFASIDGMSINLQEHIENAEQCPVCHRFSQSISAAALIIGNPQSDSLFQTYRSGERTNMRICRYCFCAGWVDLPASKITKTGQNVNKGREYLFVNTALSQASLEELLHRLCKTELISDDDSTGDADDQSPEVEDPNDQSEIAEFMKFLQDTFGIEAGDSLAVIGMSSRRLREIRGFVLQSSNKLQRTLVLRVPLEKIVGEGKVSGAVRRELIKAAMYDFWQITGGTLHYNRVCEGTPFSVDGQAISLDEMLRANRAFSIANRFARGGKYLQLNSGLFMLLLSHTREAVNRILNAKKRNNSGRFAPGSEKVKEIIDMAEQIAVQDDWQFQLGLRIVATLVKIELAPRAKGFWKNAKEQYTGVELVKWIQRLKMARDPSTTRAWGTSLINGYRRENDRGANTEDVKRILDLVEEIIDTCSAHDTAISDFARAVANMDYYLLFYYNHKQTQQTN